MNDKLHKLQLTEDAVWDYVDAAQRVWEELDTAGAPEDLSRMAASARLGAIRLGIEYTHQLIRQGEPWYRLLDEVDFQYDSSNDHEYPTTISAFLFGVLIWQDDYRDTPDATQLHNDLIEAYKNDCFTLGYKYYSQLSKDER